MINAERIAICKKKKLTLPDGDLSYWRGVRPTPVESKEDIPRLDQIRKAIVNLEFCQELLCAKMISNKGPYTASDKSS
jgi:hypothetical protein